MPTYTLTCKRCGEMFRWGSNGKQYCPACTKIRDAETAARWKQYARNRQPDTGRNIAARRDTILRMVQEGASMMRIALKIGYCEAYILEVIRERDTFKEIRRALKEREREEIRREFAEFIKPAIPDEFIKADSDTVRARSREAAWLWGG